MTSFFTKVTNQIVVVCRNYITESGKVDLWTLPRQVAMSRMKKCIKLFKDYKKNLEEVREGVSSEIRQRNFEFFQVPVLGTFHSFCKRLIAICEMFDTIDELSVLHKCHAEGIEIHSSKLNSIVNAIKGKTYDLLDHRKMDFNNDYIEFKNQIAELKIYNSKAAVKKPMKAPFARKISWARALFKRIEAPMELLKPNIDILQPQSQQRVVQTYNALAEILTEYMVLHHNAYCRKIKNVSSELQKSILITKSTETGVEDWEVNFTDTLYMMLKDSQSMIELQLNIPDEGKFLLSNHNRLMESKVKMQELLYKFKLAISKVPPIFAPLISPLVRRVECALRPGVTYLQWLSANIDDYIMNVKKTIENLEFVIKNASGTNNIRLNSLLDNIGNVFLFKLPSEPCDPEDFVSYVEGICKTGEETLFFKCLCFDKVVGELLSFLLEEGNTAYTESLNIDLYGRNLETPKQITVQRPPKPLQPGEIRITFHQRVFDLADTQRLLAVLDTAAKSVQPEISKVYKIFLEFKDVWAQDKEKQIQDFMETNPFRDIYELKRKLQYYKNLEKEILELPFSYTIAGIELRTNIIKEYLLKGVHKWFTSYGNSINRKYLNKVIEISDFLDDKRKIINLPVKELSDVQRAMNCFETVSENFTDIDMELEPIKDAYALLLKFEFPVDLDEVEKAKSLPAALDSLLKKSRQVANELTDDQFKYLAILKDFVETFKVDVIEFDDDYQKDGPMVDGITPEEASKRVDLFAIDRIKCHIIILYSVYLHRCMRLPKGCKDWSYFTVLKQRIEDFKDTCPLLTRLRNDAMTMNHWKRIEKVCNHKFDEDQSKWTLGTVMEAPLLVFKDDVEDICIAAEKEREIEAKLNQIFADWAIENLFFSQFKNRGELLLKGTEAGETTVKLEDGLMTLGSLLSNRYSAAMKDTILKWLHYLTTATEVIENWLIVQNLWVYLEAVFVGGDIAKQLPKEAERFAVIDSTWVKLMERAREKINVIKCCAEDDTMSKALPHLLEELEACQKSLVG
ncbi:unnamed protein product [Larinioides sclopetarius]|uniref:Dynein heavy chain n=1 Tax=Larinioides sclopetarius TaxID=280406 RepID=A0AAV2ACE4_9ARAC